MLKIEYTTQFKRDIKLAKRRKNNIALLQELMELIASQKPIPAKHKDHLLTDSENLAYFKMYNNHN